MTADITTQRKSTGPSTLLHALTLVFVAVTLFFALLSMILGNRISSLQTNYLKAEKETATLKAGALQEMETALKTTTVNLETAQQTLDKEKAGAERLRRQLSVAMKDLANAKADLASANQAITKLKSTLPAEPTLPVGLPNSPTMKPEEKIDGTAPPATAPQS